MTFTEASTATAAPRSSARADRAAYDLKRTTDWLDEQIAAGKKKAHSSVVTITPTLAQLLLGRNPINRPISKGNANDLASDISSGRFEFNGESIVVSNTGVLLDGQHRLEQVVATGACIESVLVFGPKEAARFTIDIGKPKSVANFLQMKGRVYAGYLSAAVNYYLQWTQNGSVVHSDTPSRPTKAQILSAADEMKGIDTSVEIAVGGIKSIRSVAAVAFCHHVFWKRAGREAADHFVNGLIEGDGLKKGDPILYCRNRLSGMGRGIPVSHRIELLFKCWNAYRLGHGVDHCKLNGRLPKVER
jgi:hypothetical protein